MRLRAFENGSQIERMRGSQLIRSTGKGRRDDRQGVEYKDDVYNVYKRNLRHALRKK